jgi:hypothetical protein
MSKSIKIISIIAGVCIVAIVLMISGLALQNKYKDSQTVNNSAVEVGDDKAIADEPETITETLTDEEGNEDDSKVVKVLYPKKGETEEELRYETVTDKDGNEIVIEYKKEVLVDSETGEEVEMWEDTAEQINIFYYIYEGTIEKIEDNKIYFMVDRENKEGDVYSLKNVKDYEIVFDINTFNLESDPTALYYSVMDGLIYEYQRFSKAGDLNFLIGKRVKIHFTEFKNPHILETYKTINVFDL